MSFINEKYEVAMKENGELKEEIKRMRQENGKKERSIEELKLDATAAVVKVNNLENQLRLKNVEIHGIEVTNNEDVREIATKVLKIADPNIAKEDIDIVRRLKSGKDKDGKLRSVNPILVMFKSANKRMSVMGGKKKLQGKNFKEMGLKAAKIFINENLTPYTKSLFYKANTLRKSNNWKYIWTNYGTIYMRREENSQVCPIRSEDDLTKLFK
jgi:hypothetical protein